MADKLRINGVRLRNDLLKLAEIGGTEKGGVSRLALTDEDKLGRDLLVKWMREAGLHVMVDGIGNIFGLRSGKDLGLSPVMVGSHIDTQLRGGKFDGNYGVIGALEIARTLNENEVEMDRSLAVVSWTNEEGSRFSPPLMGSGVYTGAFTLDFARSRMDRDGKALGEELERIGYGGGTPSRAESIDAYLELHIEQGPVLESESRTIGVVRGIVGIVWLDVTVIGESNQAGPTPMHLRSDALLAAADMIRAVRNIPLRVADLVSTVGSVEVKPNSRNTIPGEARFTVDFRSPRDESIERALMLFRGEVESISVREGVKTEISEVWSIPYTRFSERCVEAVRTSTLELGYSQMSIVSGAGHDAKYLADICDTGMIFVPSRRGRSHCEEEDTDWADLEAGCNVALHTIMRLAAGSEGRRVEVRSTTSG